MNTQDNGGADVTACPHCSSRELYTRRLSSAGGRGPYFLAGLGEFLHYAEFDVVVCARCGLTQFFAEPMARRNVREHPDWIPAFGRDRMAEKTDSDAALTNDPPESTQSMGPDEDLASDVSEPTRCMGCGALIPAFTDTCPQCGWSYKQTQ